MNIKRILTLKVIIIAGILLVLIFSGCIENEKKIKEDEVTFDIQQLINTALPGDTIYIQDSAVFDNVIINKPIKLIGKDVNSTIIDGSYGEVIIEIQADNVTIENLTFRNSGGNLDNAAIKINSNNNIIKNCIFDRTKTGIYLNYSENNFISNSLFHNNGEGIYLKQTLNNCIENCQFYHNAFGLHLEESFGTTINKCYIHTNGLGIYAKKSSNSKIYQCSVSDNNQDGGGVWFFNCKNFDIYDCNIEHNGAGVKLSNSEGTLSYCNLDFNMYHTIKLENSKNVIISNCNVRNSYRNAIVVQGSDCNIEHNNIVGNTLFGLKYGDYSCNARNNWWGSIIGPSYVDLGFGDRISFKLFGFKFIPWAIKPFDDVGSSWDTKDIFSKSEISFIRFKPIDTKEEDEDNDGCPDWWEKKWGYNPLIWDNHANLDLDNDGLNNIEECYVDKYGSNPFYKDIFLEVDWLESNKPGVTNKPSENLIREVEATFKEHEINLHVDLGNLGGGEEIPVHSKLKADDIRNFYWQYFLENNLTNPRKGIFHYALIANEIEELYGGFVFIGWDHLDTICLATQSILGNDRNENSKKRIVGGLMHELGHTLGLIIDDYGGIDNDESYEPLRKSFWKYVTYKSCMNYLYAYDLLDYSDGSNGKNDYNDWENMDLSFFKNTIF